MKFVSRNDRHVGWEVIRRRSAVDDFVDFLPVGEDVPETNRVAWYGIGSRWRKIMMLLEDEPALLHFMDVLRIETAMRAQDTKIDPRIEDCFKVL